MASCSIQPFSFLVYMTALGATSSFRPRLDGPMALLTVARRASCSRCRHSWGRRRSSADRRTKLVFDQHVAERMLIKLDLTQTFADVAARWAPVASLQAPLALAMATVVF